MNDENSLQEELKSLANDWEELSDKSVSTVPAQACNDMAAVCAKELRQVLEGHDD